MDIIFHTTAVPDNTPANIRTIGLCFINYVSFSISGEPMLDTDGTAIGALGRDSFVFGKLPMK